MKENKELAEVNAEMTLSVDAVVRQREKIKEIQERVMRRDVDFGNVPGCPKPSLFKSGAEKLCSTFMLASEPEVEDLSTSEERRYRVKVRLIHQSTGIFMGAGIGEASTSEEKYKWRQAICDAEFEATEPESRRLKFKKDGTSIKQIRTNPADLANTVLKMAKKRAQIDAVLTVLGASDFFTQDVEDMPAEYLNSGKTAPTTTKPPMPKATPEGRQTVRCIITKAFAKRNPKAPQSFGIKSADGKRIDGYYQTHDETLIETLNGHIEQADAVDLTYHVEHNGQYVNIVIDEVAAVVEEQPKDTTAAEVSDNGEDYNG